MSLHPDNRQRFNRTLLFVAGLLVILLVGLLSSRLLFWLINYLKM